MEEFIGEYVVVGMGALVWWWVRRRITRNEEKRRLTHDMTVENEKRITLLEKDIEYLKAK